MYVPQVVLAAMILADVAAATTTLTLDTDKEVYDVGETVQLTLTLVMTATGPLYLQAVAGVSWDGAVGSGAQLAQQQPIETVSFSYVPFSEACLAEGPCWLFLQLGHPNFGPPIAQEVTGAHSIEAIAEGDLSFEIVEDGFSMFGLTPIDVVFTGNALNARVVPEPSRVVLQGVGLLGLATLARLRRAT